MFDPVPGVGRDRRQATSVGAGARRIAALRSSPTLAEQRERRRIDTLRRHAAELARLQAQVWGDIVDIHAAVVASGIEPDFAQDATTAEVRVSLRMTRRAAQREVDLALDLSVRLPMVLSAVRAGLVDRSRAVVVSDATAHLPDPVAREVVDRILEDAPRLTTGQLRHRIARIALEIHATSAVEEYRSAVEERSVSCTQTVSGTAEIVGRHLPADRAAAAMRRVDRIARRLRSPAEGRTMDQLRADVFLDLLLGGHEAAPAGDVELRVDIATLARLAETPGELAGFGPVVADIARQFATARSGGTWGWVVTNGAEVVGAGTTRRRPDTATARVVTATNQTCVFPGCRMPASDCDLDHTTPWADGGSTDPGNLAPLCEADHVARHRFGWTYRRTEDGDFLWTTLLGQVARTSGRDP